MRNDFSNDSFRTLTAKLATLRARNLVLQDKLTITQNRLYKVQSEKVARYSVFKYRLQGAILGFLLTFSGIVFAFVTH